jgi:ribonuclease HI
MTHLSLLEIFTDGGARGNPGPGASAFIVYKDKRILFQRGYFFKQATNNVAEYFAVLMAMDWITKNPKIVGDGGIYFYLDSELVAKQINGEYKIKNERLKNIFNKILNIKNSLSDNEIVFHHIKRENNKAADALVNKTVDENT